MNDDIYEIMNQLEQYNGELLERHHTDKKKIERLQKQLDVAKDLLKKCLVHLSAGYLGTDEIPVNVLIDQINQLNNN